MGFWFLLFQFFGLQTQDRPASGDVVFRLEIPTVQRIVVWEYSEGDYASWKKPGMDDSSWRWINSGTIQTRPPNIHWFRTQVFLTGKPNPYHTFMVRVAGLRSAFEIYWDGVLIGMSGKVGTDRSQEKTGDLFAKALIHPVLVTPGRHLLALRVSNHHKPVFGKPILQFNTLYGYQTPWMIQQARTMRFSFFWVGIYGICFVFSLALFLGGGRHRSYMLFGLLCFFNGIYSLRSLLTNFPLDIQTNEIFNILRFIPNYTEAILLTFFILFNFEFPKKVWHMGFVLFWVILHEMFRIPPLGLISWRELIILFFCTGLLIHSVVRKKAGGLTALLGVSALFLDRIIWLFFPGGGFMFRPHLILIQTSGYILFLSLIFLSISRHIREQNQRLVDAKIRAQRLEAELLKEQIKPHFLMNTLFSIISWFRKSPSTAVKLIEALATEFQIVHRISSKSLISLEEEIEICRKHLEIMGYRRNVRFSLETIGRDFSDQVPPLIFHTLIENGLTHAFEPNEDGRFQLERRESSNEVIYVLRNPGKKLAAISRDTGSEIEEGLGLKYIQTRLEESFPGRWKLKYGMVNGFWEVEINIHKACHAHIDRGR